MNSFKTCSKSNVKLNVNILTLAETVNKYKCHLRKVDKNFIMKLSKHIEEGEYGSIAKLYGKNTLTVVLKYFEDIEYFEMCSNILDLIKNMNELHSDKINENLDKCS